MSQVSVIIPSYNSASYLAEAIQSVLDQTFSDFEIIVVDDGSTDHTPGIVRSFDDRRIKYLHQANEGPSGARNTGIRAAQGTYVTFLDADDWFLPQKLSLQTQFLAAHPEVGCVAGGWIETDARGLPRRTVEPWRHTPELGLVTWLKGAPMVVHAVLIRRSWLLQVGMFDESILRVEDHDLWLRLATAGCQFAWQPSIVCRYRFHDKNMSNDWQRMRNGHLTALDKIYARPDLPSEIKSIHNQVYAMSYAISAARAYGAGAVEAAQHEVVKAITLDPSLAVNHPCPIVYLLVNWRQNYYLLGEERYYRLLEHNLPPQIPFARWQVRKAVSSRYMSAVFSTHNRAEPMAVCRSLIQGLRIYPPWILNRGILSIILRTIIPKIL